jgi:formylglycine-generating enzyme required for sulfatase activity
MAKVVTTRSAANQRSTSAALAGSDQPFTNNDSPFENMVWIPGGTFLMGSDRHYPEEAPVHQETVSGFWMDRYLVTNSDFTQFVAATDYVTLAERVPDAAQYPGALPHMLVAGSVVFRQPNLRVDLRNHFHWWTYVPGANWRHPIGPGSSLEGLQDHPVVHVAYEDVEAYAKWAGREVPTEAEWEFAARGGLDGAIYSWGNEFAPGGKMMANTWQGEFPVQNLLVDGFERTSPVGSFPANGYGLHDMAGNVWEWTSDWYQEHRAVKACCSGRAKGDGREKSHDPLTPNIRIPRKVLKGGSYLCAANYCLRYRPAARIPQQVDTGTCHQGFRLIARPKEAQPQSGN